MAEAVCARAWSLHIDSSSVVVFARRYLGSSRHMRELDLYILRWSSWDQATRQSSSTCDERQVAVEWLTNRHGDLRFADADCACDRYSVELTGCEAAGPCDWVRRHVRADRLRGDDVGKDDKLAA